MDQPAEKTDRLSPPVVAIDGNRIRTIRETKKLTQLYVASMVGVTTDTISRWENNRYPTIKRDNAEKLASALEVALAEILRTEEEHPPGEPVSEPAAQRPRRRWWPLAGCLVLGLGIAGFFLVQQLAVVPTAVRRLPRFTAPGELVPVQIVVTSPDSGDKGMIVKETLPPGWQLVAAQPATATPRGPVAEIKWLLPGDSGRRTIAYAVRAPVTGALQNRVTFAGKLVTQSAGSARSDGIGGDQAVTVAERHWADTNGDGRIDDSEIMPAYYLCEELKGLGLDWKTIEAIWSGKGYRWGGAGKGFQVQR